uniref:RRM domain-containing protein n=1 Tax=Panagrolaimus superbus TaxID=310955 RepID=A0A914ZC33_9BILA
MDENGLCPACRKPYPEDPANFQPITPLEMQQKRKQKEKKKNISECRKHLSAYRVLQRNLVYVVGLSPRIADPEILKRSDYFGKYGRVVKVAVGTLPSSQGNAPVHTAYVTFSRVEDALKTIQETNSLVFDGRMIKTSLGTTKYCSNFLRGQTCNKQECMYLHEVAPPELSFTKEDMHQGKHTEYEKKLLEKMAEQLEAAAATSAKEECEAAAKLGPFPEDEEVSSIVVHEDEEEEEQTSNEVGSSDRASSESKPPSSIHEDSIENDFPPIENIKIVDPVFPDEPEPNVNNRSPPPSLPTSSQKYEDDLGFDPFTESMKGLEELMRGETETQNQAAASSYHQDNSHMHRNGDSMSRLMYGMERPPMDSFQPSSFSHTSMHNSFNGPYRSEMERQHLDFSSSPFGSCQNGFNNPSQSHYQRQTSQPQQEKTYYNSNNAYNNYMMPPRQHSTLPETPAYQPYRTEQQSSYNPMLSNSHDSRDAFKALLPNVNVSFVSSSENRNMFSSSPNQYSQQSNNAFQRQMYRGSGMEYGFPMPSHSHSTPFGPEPPGFSTSKYMTTPPPGFDSTNHGQGPN